MYKFFRYQIKLQNNTSVSLEVSPVSSSFFVIIIHFMYYLMLFVLARVDK